jgi:hypothetical protein
VETGGGLSSASLMAWGKRSMGQELQSSSECNGLFSIVISDCCKHGHDTVRKQTYRSLRGIGLKTGGNDRVE